MSKERKNTGHLEIQLELQGINCDVLAAQGEGGMRNQARESGNKSLSTENQFECKSGNGVERDRWEPHLSHMDLLKLLAL
jgi:hypothetical protein